MKGRTIGAILGNIIKSFNVLAKKVRAVVVELELEAELGGGIQSGVLPTATKETFHQCSRSLLDFCKDSLGNFEGMNPQQPSTKWLRNIYVLRSAVLDNKLLFMDDGFVHVPVVHDIKHTIKELEGNFADAQRDIQESSDERGAHTDSLSANNKRASSERRPASAQERLSLAFRVYDEAVSGGDGAVSVPIFQQLSNKYWEWSRGVQEKDRDKDKEGGALAEAVKVSEEQVVNDLVFLLKQIDVQRCSILAAIIPLLSKPNFYRQVLNTVGGGFLREFLDVQVGDESVRWTEDDVENYNERIMHLFGNNQDSLRMAFGNAFAHKLVVRQVMEDSRGQLPDVVSYEKKEVLFSRVSEMWLALDVEFKKRKLMHLGKGDKASKMEALYVPGYGRPHSCGRSTPRVTVLLLKRDLPRQERRHHLQTLRLHLLEVREVLLPLLQQSNLLFGILLCVASLGMSALSRTAITGRGRRAASRSTEPKRTTLASLGMPALSRTASTGRGRRTRSRCTDTTCTILA